MEKKNLKLLYYGSGVKSLRGWAIFWVVFAVTLLIIAVSIFFYKNYVENKAWGLANKTNTIESIREYLSSYPNGKFLKEAEQFFEKYVVKDIEGNVYHIITIGTQVWMVENLKTTKYNDGTSIPLVSDNTAWSGLTSPSYCWYNNDTANKNIYGALYNWYTVKTGKLAPIGWHVPTNAEWITLENYLIANGYNYDAPTTGNKIAKSLAATSGWDSSAYAGTPGNDQASNNSSGFAGLPGGYRSLSGTFGDVGGYGDWWSSSENTYDAWYRNLGYDNSLVYSSSLFEQFGFSVRCLRDN